MTESFYDLLGVPADADTDEIQRAYRQRIKETHPDLNDDPDASEKTARLVEARDVLTDDDERARYDRLGHDSYVDDEFGTPGHSAGAGDGRSASDAASGAGSSGATNSRARAEERRRRERRAREDVDFGAGTSRSSTSSSGSTATGGGTTSASTTGTSASGGSATSGAATGGSRASATGGARATSATNEPPPWSDTSDGWAARAPTNPPPGLATHVFEAILEAPATAIVTFLLYPLLVLGAFLPSFPLAVNVIVGACLLAMIAAAQSVPGLGIAIYGAWSLIGPVGLVWTGTHPFSPIGLIVLGTTWFPLGFSLLTYKVLDA